MTGNHWLLAMALGLGLAASGMTVGAEAREDATGPGKASAAADKKRSADVAPKRETVTLDKLPAAVRATLLKVSEGGTLDKIEFHPDCEVAHYVTSANINDKFYDIVIDTDGTLRCKRLDKLRVALDKVPAAARATLIEEAEGVKIVVVYKDNMTSKGGKVRYVTYVTIENLDCKIIVAEDGALISKEVADEDDDVDDEEANDPALG